MIPENKSLHDVARFMEFDLENDPELLEIVELASAITGSPYALIALQKDDTLYLKAWKGIDITRGSADMTFCAYTLQQDGLLLINDIFKDNRFINNANVSGGLRIRFFAGMPLIAPGGQKFGVLAVYDLNPKTLDDHQQLIIKILATQTVKTIELRAGIDLFQKKQSELEEQKLHNKKITDQNQSLLKIAHVQAHEFRAPLTSIMGLMRLIKEADYQVPREYLEMLEEAVYTLDGRIRHIITDVDHTVINKFVPHYE
jgi:GAF domain-containing protein